MVTIFYPKLLRCIENFQSHKRSSHLPSSSTQILACSVYPKLQEGKLKDIKEKEKKKFKNKEYPRISHLGL